MDACSAILLSKASSIDIFTKKHNIVITTLAYDEIIKGKEKKFDDALLIEKLFNERAFRKVEIKNKKLFRKFQYDFGLGDGESSTIVFAIENKIAVLTDNKQARKASKIYGLKLIGSPEIVVSLFKAKAVNKDKAFYALEKLRKAGWFQDYIIEMAMEEIKNG